MYDRIVTFQFNDICLQFTSSLLHFLSVNSEDHTEKSEILLFFWQLIPTWLKILEIWISAQLQVQRSYWLQMYSNDFVDILLDCTVYITSTLYMNNHWISFLNYSRESINWSCCFFHSLLGAFNISLAFSFDPDRLGLVSAFHTGPGLWFWAKTARVMALGRGETWNCKKFYSFLLI